jgi:SAM-dependent methyltransferase
LFRGSGKPLNVQPTERHLSEIRRNRDIWGRKPLLKAIYGHFYELIRENVAPVLGTTVELGSGIGSIKELIPECVTTDIFPNPWIDRRENAYTLSFPDASISNLILLDVFHHLKFPGSALTEFKRIIAPRGRIILLEPGMGIFGKLIYGLFHHEPLALREPITWFAPPGFDPERTPYYAAQGNAWRIFVRNEFREKLEHWKIHKVQQLPEMAYIASGGFTKPQLYPDRMLSLIRKMEKVAARWPALFATRMLVVLEKRDGSARDTFFDSAEKPPVTQNAAQQELRPTDILPYQNRALPRGSDEPRPTDDASVAHHR